MRGVGAQASLPLVGKVERSALMAMSVGVLMAATWFFNRHAYWAWPLQDILSVSLCIHILSLLRFPDAKVPPAPLPSTNKAPSRPPATLSTGAGRQCAGWRRW